MEETWKTSQSGFMDTDLGLNGLDDDGDDPDDDCTGEDNGTLPGITGLDE